jgi:RimJ/RimL family protein N-acetyltransferase
MDELRLGVAISLRIPTLGDADELAAAVDESRGELMPWMDWCTIDYGLGEARQWIDSVRTGHVEGTGFEFLVVGDHGGILGACGLNGVNTALRFANLGYWVRSSATGRGVAVAAVGRVADWAFRHTDLERLEIVVAVANVRSHRVAIKAGAAREGVLRRRLRAHGTSLDAVMYSIVRQGPAHSIST